MQPSLTRLINEIKAATFIEKNKSILIAIDETKNWKQIFVWSAIDVAMKCSAMLPREEAAFLCFEGDAYCENKPEIVVEVSGKALNRLGLSYEHDWEMLLRDSFQRRALWHSIITGGVYLDSPAANPLL